MKALSIQPIFLICVAVVFNVSVFCQIERIPQISAAYSGVPWENDTHDVGLEIKICWQFDRVDGSLANDSGIVAGSYWPFDPENWPATNGQEMRTDELDLNYAVFRYNGGAGVFRSHGQWCRYTIKNKNAGYFYFKFRGRPSVERDGFPLIATIETPESLDEISSVVLNSFDNQTKLIQNTGLTSWYATIDSLFIPAGTFVLRVDLPSVDDTFNSQGRFGEFAFSSTDSNLNIIEDTISPFLFEHHHYTDIDTNNPLVFQIYLPDIIDTVKGVCFYVAGGSMNGLWWMSDVAALREHRNYYVQNNFAYMVAHLHQDIYDSYSYNTINSWMADAVFESLEALADSTEHPELAYSPLFLFGHSNGGRFSHHFVMSKADRVIGAFLSRGSNTTAIDDATKRKGLGVPLMFIAGENDSGFSPEYVRGCFNTGRSQGAFWAYAMELGAGHNPQVTDSNLVFSFFRDALNQRIPETSYFNKLPVLKTIYDTSGYLGSNDNFKFARYECYPNDTLSASWLPGFESALAWQRFAADNGSLLDTIGCPTFVDPIKENSLAIFPNPTNDIINIEGAEGENIYIYNLDGRLEKTIMYAKQSESINLSDMKTGLYLIRIGNRTVKISIIK